MTGSGLSTYCSSIHPLPLAHSSPVQQPCLLIPAPKDPILVLSPSLGEHISFPTSGTHLYSPK